MERARAEEKQLKRPRWPEPSPEELLLRLRYLIAAAHAVDARALTSRPSGDPRASEARSVAIALARDLLYVPLGALAAHFGCADESEVAAHCNRIAERAEREPQFQTALTFLKGACARVMAT